MDINILFFVHVDAVINRTNDEEDSDNVALIAGISAAGAGLVFFIIIATVVILYFLYKRRTYVTS